jgi:hypothetical protein
MKILNKISRWAIPTLLAVVGLGFLGLFTPSGWLATVVGIVLLVGAVVSAGLGKKLKI